MDAECEVSREPRPVDKYMLQFGTNQQLSQTACNSFLNEQVRPLWRDVIKLSAALMLEFTSCEMDHFWWQRQLIVHFYAYYEEESFVQEIFLLKLLLSF